MKKRGMIALGVAAVLVGAGVVGLKLFRDKLVVTLPDYPPVKQAHWINQGWNEEQRNWFHHADQGTQTLNIPYEWFIALEQPRLSLIGDVGRLNDPAYLDRFGLIPGATKGGEIQLPIGIARGTTMRTPDGAAWLNPRTKVPMHGIGLTCAGCHTGRLTYRETALLIDGGPALTDLGKFRQALGISLLFTKWVPGRFDRFARNVLGDDASEADKAGLRQQLDDLWARFDIVRQLDKRVADASVEEGYGRLDALNRIGNQVFGLDLGKEGRDKNYVATTAPVNFPHIWNTSWFDWVQYNASIQQPMVRNAGEALGVSAPLNLMDPKQRLFSSGVQVLQLASVEKQLAGDQPDEQAEFSGLLAPGWPEDLLGEVNIDLAAKGAALYENLCQGCHLPPVDSKAFWASENWRPPNQFGQRHLHVNVIPIAKVGTDPAQAEDMINRKVWLPASLELKTLDGAFGPALGELVEKVVNHWYDNYEPPVPPAERDAMNGYRPNGIQAPRAYKARPLNGVWATPPFLHNGSVPSVYALLSPASERPNTFHLGRREFDPVCMGYQLTTIPASASKPEDCLKAQAGADTRQSEGLFELDTSLRGNRNTGHEFTDARQGEGVIGRGLNPEERLALIEFLKTDCVNGRRPERGEGALQETSCERFAAGSTPGRWAK